jgi:hypothetical protein
MALLLHGSEHFCPDDNSLTQQANYPSEFA